MHSSGHHSNDDAFGISNLSPRTVQPQSKTREIPSASGNFVLHVPIASEILAKSQFQDGEFNHFTYTAVTRESRAPEGQPELPHEIDTFPEKYQLRQRMANRQIKIALVITMYNEDDKLFVKSMSAIQRNITQFCTDKHWGPDGWKNFVVVIVSDGRLKVNKKVLDCLEVMGVYANGITKSSVNETLVEAHIFEATSQIRIAEDGDRFKIERAGEGVVPTQIIFLLKEQNAKKINSHKWFFNAICETLQPDVTMLVDVGTKPDDTSLIYLYRAFERNPLVGGACGEIKADIGDFGRNLLNPLVAAQNFEYKMSNILDKPLESIFGYISVLPGAFSAYKYSALQGRPLECYFKGESPGADIFTSNLYLAEDRILCFELITKRDQPWILKYVKSANAATDVPSTLSEFVSQRRRWLNGSFFASIHALANFTKIFTSAHTTYQKLLFSIEFVYNAINVLFTWFAIANFYLSFYFLFDIRKGLTQAPIDVASSDPFYPNGDLVFQLLQGLYIGGMFTMFITALGNRPRGTRWLYMLLSVFFAVLMGLMIFMAGWRIRLSIKSFQANNVGYTAPQLWAYLKTDHAFRDMVISVGATYVVYLVSSLLHLDPWHVFTSMIQYFLLFPTYLNIFMVYSFCNLHDVSWGTKGSTTVTESAAVVKEVKPDGTTIFQYKAMDQTDVNTAWKAALKKVTSPDNTEVVDKRDAKTKAEDATKEFRTKVVLFWVFCNVALIIFFTNTASLSHFFPNNYADGDTSNPYLTFLFWSVAGLSLVRFIGSILYIFQWWAEKIADAM
ncbi:Chitin synthase, class 2 [Terramyces sp. JEL0728]|nr:Chitin synthase, class 2 [Terramyces sp. JEL0728]